MRTETEGTAEWRAAMNAALGPDARLFAIIARGGFALRYGPLSLDQCDELIELGQNEHFPVMITADCGALPDADLAMSLFGETREARATLKAEGIQRALDMTDAMRVLGDNVVHLLGLSPARSGSRVEGVRRAFGPVDEMAHKLTAELDAIEQRTPRLYATTPGLEDDDAAPLHDTREDTCKPYRDQVGGADDFGCNGELPKAARATLDRTLDADEATLGQDDEAKREAIRSAVMIGAVKSERMVNRFLASLHQDGFDVVPRKSVSENSWINVRDAAVELYREVIRAPSRLASAELMRRINAMRHALVDVGVRPRDLENR